MQAVEAANGGLSGTFGEGSKIRQYSAWSMKPFHFSNYNQPEHKESLASLLQESGNEGRKAWLEHSTLSAVSTHSLLAAEIPANRSAEEAMRDKPHAIVFTTRQSQKSNRPLLSFLHYRKASVIEPYTILPLEYSVKQDWTSLSASDQKVKMEQLQHLQQIPGIVPLREMLEFTNEVHLYHPSKEYSGSWGDSIRYYPYPCHNYNCSICYTLHEFGKEIKYKEFFGA